MASSEPSAKNHTSSAQSPVPPLVDRILIFFYVLVWVNLAFSVSSALNDTQDGDYSYLIPAGLYALTLIVHLISNHLHYQRVGGLLSDQLWGFDQLLGRQIAFILISTVLIFWMNAESLNFISLYFSLISATFGMFSWRIAVPLVSLQVLALCYQIGVFPWQSEDGSIELGVVVGILSYLTILVLMIVLIRSLIWSNLLLEELKATKQKLEVALVKEKEVAVLRERNRMAREMHDVLGHALVLVAVKIEAAQRLQAVDPERAAGELEATKELVRQSMADLRTSLAEMRSPELEDGALPLERALSEWASRTAKEAGLSLRFGAEPGVEMLPAATQDALWRVGREALLNIVKHAQARNVEVNVFRKDGAVYLSVADDGVGIPHLAEGSARLEVEGHYGIRGMRERVEALGGNLALKPGRERRGTLVLASIPLPPEEPEPAQRLWETLTVEGMGKKAEISSQKSAS